MTSTYADSESYTDVETGGSGFYDDSYLSYYGSSYSESASRGGGGGVGGGSGKVRSRGSKIGDVSNSDSGPAEVFSWAGVSYSVKEKKILDNAFGSVGPGEMLAIMGPSGSGKSTLLNMLAGRVRSEKGDYLCGSTPRGAAFYAESAYCQQDDALVGALTVEENIKYSVRLRTGLKASERNQRVKETIEELGLDKVKKSRVGTPLLRGVSGGERKRTGIAVELVTRPKYLFLDEPTSALDSSAAQKVMELVKETARRDGQVVCASIHQPSSQLFELFDKILLLAAGKTIFFGTSKECEEFFESHGETTPENWNPSDHFLEVLARADFETDDKRKAREHRRLEEMAKDNARSSKARDIISRVNPRGGGSSEKGDGVVDDGGKSVTYPISFPAQVWILTERNLIETLRNPLYIWVRVLLYALLGIMLATTWLNLSETDQRAVQDRLSLHFFIPAFTSFMSVAAVPALIESRIIFLRERASRAYRTSSYIVSTGIISLVTVAIITVIFWVITYFLIGLNTQTAKQPFVYLGIYFLCLLVAEMVAVFFSAVVPWYIVAIALTSFFNGAMMVTQGFFRRFDKIPWQWKWLSYVNFQRYSFESLVANDFRGLRYDCDVSNSTSIANSTATATTSTTTFCFFKPVSQNSTNSTFFLGEDVLAEYGYEDVNVGEWAAVLVGISLSFRILTYIVLRLKK